MSPASVRAEAGERREPCRAQPLHPAAVAALIAAGTLAEWVAEWMRGHKATAAGSNWQRDEQTIAKHITPRIGPARLGELTARRINLWVSEMNEAGVSPSERKRAVATLKKILRAHERVPRAIWERVNKPKRKPAESRHLYPDELRALPAAADARGPLCGAMVRAGVAAGLRAGELLGLQWRDFDPARGRLSVRRAVCYRTGVLKEPKTDESRRTVPIGRVATAALAALPRGAEDAPIFPTPRGRTHYRYLNWVHGRWWPLVAAAGLSGRGIVPRSLRHTCAGQLIAAGKNIVVVSKRLGHATVTRTLNTYAHLCPDDQQEAADALDAALS